MSLDLPSLLFSDVLVEDTGTPTLRFQKWWNEVRLKLANVIAPNGVITASGATTTHKLPITVDNTVYYILLSDV